MTIGYHLCEYCHKWHGCTPETKPDPPGDGCLINFVGAILIWILMFPLIASVIDIYGGWACDRWPNWSRRCADIEARSPEKLNQRLKKLEESNK